MLDKIDLILSKAEDLPVMPHIGMEILNLIEDKYSVPADFQLIIESDQVLTLKILKLANSAYYGFPREIISIKDAVVILGLDTLKSLVLSLLTRQMLAKDLHAYGLKKGQLWEHSLAVAMIARSVARFMKFASLEKYFVAGLLHDIGKILLEFSLKDYAESIKFQVNEGGLDFFEAENRVLGVDHALIGSKLVEVWNLPNFLVNVILWHHNYKNAPAKYRTDAYMLNLADRLAYTIARGSGSDFMVNKTVDPEEYGKLGLTAGDIEGLLGSIKESLEQVQISD